MSQNLSKPKICDGCAKEKELFPMHIQGIGMSWQCRKCANTFMEFEKRHQERKSKQLFSSQYRKRWGY